MGNLHNKRVFPYKTLLVLFSSLLSLIYISLIGLQCYTATSNYLQNHFSLQEKSALSQATQTMNEQLSRTKTLAEMLSKDNASLAALAAYDAAGAKEKLEVQRHISSLLYAMRVVNPNITSLAVFTEKSVLTMGDCTLYGGDRKGFRRTFPEMKAETETVFHVPEKESSPEQTPYRDLADRTFFSVPLSKFSDRGYFCVILRQDFFEHLMVDMHGFAIADERGTILLNQTSLPDSAILETLDSGDSKALLRRNIYSSSDHNFQNLRMVYMGNIAGLQEEISNIRYWLLGFGSLIFLISFLLANQISKKMLQPLAPLLQAISDPSPLHRPPVETVQKKRRLSFQDSILWYLLSIVLAGSILLSAASFCFFSRLITQKVSASAESSFRQVSNNVQQLMDNLVAASRYICYDDGTQQLLRDPKAASGQQKPLFGMELFTYDTATCLYGNGRAAILSSNPSLFPQRNPQLPKNDVIWGYNEHSKNNHYFSLLMSINDKISYLPIGALQTKLDELFLEKQYAILSSAHCEAYVHTKDGLIVSHPNKNFIGATLPPTDNSGTPRDENRICLRYRIAGTPFYLTASYSRDMIAAEKRSLLISSGYILVIMLLSVFLTSFWLSHLLSARFHKLSEQLAGMDLDHLYPAEHEDSMIEEIAQMNRAFDAMVCRIQKLVEESLESADRQHALELSRNRAEFQMLQSQINPHFLYNTFESVNFMIRTDKRGQAISMLNGLSHMLRFAAKKDDSIIALAEEESYAKTYVEIMNMRYADIMTVTMNIPQELLPLHIIKFVLQPLIENAIYHGVRPKGFGGEITVTGQVADHKLLLSVRDNGMGMSQEKLAELVSDLAENKKKDTIGLSNIHNRIRMTYGAPYGLRISSREEHGTTVTIILPLLP